MKHKFVLFIPLLFIALFWLSLRPVPVNTAKINADFEALIPKKHKIDNVFKKTTDAEGNTKWVKVRNSHIPPAPTQDTLQTRLSQLSQFQNKHLTSCNAIHKIIIHDDLTNRLNKLNIVFERNKNPSTPHNISEKRKQDYAHKIKTYLTIKKTPQDLINYGENELRLAHGLLHNLEQRIINSGSAISIEGFEKSTARTFTTEAEINAAFDRRRTIINANLNTLFKPYNAPKTSVKMSRRTDRFYAIGSYQKSTFIYYWNGKAFLAKDLDYLMIHELVPGHHLQIFVAKKNPLCPNVMKTKSVFSEGWATYIESFGPELGLLQTHEQQLGQLDWNLIRSIRIILDVRIHHDGWTKNQVIEFWNANMPKRLHPLVHREYARMQKMPMQAITYKVGSKAIFELRAREEVQLGENFDIREFHDTLLRLGAVPLHALDEIYALAIQVDKTP